MTEPLATQDPAAEWLPPLVRDIADLVGLDAALAIVDHWGGVRWHVPVSVETAHELVDIIGDDAADTFIRVYSGERIDVPRCLQAMIETRRAMLYEDYDRGLKPPELARKYHCTERWVWALLARRRDQANDQQMGLL